VLTVAIAVALPLIVMKRSFPQQSAQGPSCPQSSGTRVTLVSEGDYFLEKHLAAAADAQRIAPGDYPPPDVANDRDAVLVFDGFAPQSVPAAGRFIWINCVPPGREVRVTGEAGLRDTATLCRPLGWRDEHPILKNLNLHQLRIASQLRLSIPREAEVLVDGTQGPLIVLDRDGLSTHLIVAFSPRESTWPLHESFGQFLKQAVDYLAQQPTHADVTGPTLMNPHDALVMSCPPLQLAAVPLRRGTPLVATILVVR
jgi:hypothetical protein